MIRLLADENVDMPTIRGLRAVGHDVSSVGETTPSIMDENVLALAYQEERVLLTFDKDFGELVFRRRLPHAGVLLCRVAEIPMPERLTLITQILAQYGEELSGGFGVLTGHLFRLKKRA